MSAWGRSLIAALNWCESRETPLMRMFRIEYSREYQQMKRLGCNFTEDTIREFMKSNR